MSSLFTAWLDGFLMSYEVVKAVTIIQIILTSLTLIGMILLYAFKKRSNAKYGLITYLASLILFGGLLVVGTNWENMTDKFMLMWISILLAMPWAFSISVFSMTNVVLSFPPSKGNHFKQQTEQWEREHGFYVDGEK